MPEDNAPSITADLRAAAVVQAEAAHVPWIFEWGEHVLTQQRRLWRHLEEHEAHAAIAYEDKAAAKVRVLEEATADLWHLQKALMVKRLPVQHRRHLRRQQGARHGQPAEAQRVCGPET